MLKDIKFVENKIHQIIKNTPPGSDERFDLLEEFKAHCEKLGYGKEYNFVALRRLGLLEDQIMEILYGDK